VRPANRWDHVRALRHPGWTLDRATWTASFTYELEELRFTETVQFPAPPEDPDDDRLTTFHRVLDLLYVAAGTSYYKIAAPREVVLDTVALAGGARAWATGLYRFGLAEFAYRNDLAHVLEVAPSGAAGPTASLRKPSTGRPLVAVGGGKDSIVSVEALRGLDPVLFAVNPNDIITRVMDVAGLTRLAARRRLDPQVFELNRTGAYNGHVPVTAINSLIAVGTAILSGLGPVVMSNESSASSPNLDWHGHPVNHQWSKGIEAEGQLRAALRAQAGLSDAYFSLLRPLSELHIAGLFAGFTAYDAVMTSCNAAFKLSDRTQRWCGHCPKCRFVFLVLAASMPRARLVNIFGADLLDDPTQLPGYRELAGVAAHKPFECVGEIAESLVALRLLTSRDEWADATVLRQLVAEVPAADWPSEEETATILGGAGPHFAPPEFAAALESLGARRAAR
jgi:hypothetical protein